MARTTLEMFIKIVGANKVSKALDNVSNSAKNTHNQVEKNKKANAQFSAGMSGLGATAIVGAAGLAAKSLLDFSISAIQAASSAQEAAGAFGTTFAGAAEKLNEEIAKNANLFGLTQAEAQQLISVFGAVAQGMGFTQEESADLSADLFSLAGDIASFNNITAGAEPVLRAFQSAIVGEREALKTYGIAISEAEVQTKAFEMTGKTSADALTRQEKALATSELLFEKAAVQIGNAERESEGFAAQMLVARSSTQELREELGEQLLPAAGEIVKIFNVIRDESTPGLIARFADLNLQILGTIEIFRILRETLGFGDKETEESMQTVHNYTTTWKIAGKVLKAFGLISTANTKIEKAHQEQLEETKQKTLEYHIEMGKARGEIEKQRLATLKSDVQTTKISRTLEQKLIPVLGEQNRLIAENIDLEIDRNKILGLLNSANDDLEKAENDRAKALKDVEELQIAENVADAKAAKTKAELQTEIALLTKAEEDGKDVAIDLALARANLAEAEFELANESDNLVRAREILEIAEDNLTKAIDNQTEAFQRRNDVLIDSLDLTARQVIENQRLAESFQLTPERLIGLPVGAPNPIFSPTDVPNIPVQDFSTRLVAGRQQLSTIDFNLNLTDAIGEIIQKENIKIQERGNTFVLEE
jgi:hypothetical protein